MTLDVALSIVFYLPFRNDMTGGPTTFLNLVKGLKKKDHLTLSFITQKKSELSNRIQDLGIDVYILPFPSLLENKNKEALDYSFLQKANVLKQLLKYNYEIGKLLKEINCDVFVTRNIKNIFYTALGAKFGGSMLIWDIGLEPDSKGLIKWLHYFGLFLSNKIVTQAKSQPREIFSKLQYGIFKKKFNTIYPGIDDVRKKALVEPSIKRSSINSKLQIVCVGSVIPRKNQKMILEAIKEFDQDSIIVDFIGPITNESYNEELQKFVKDHKLESTVSFLGWRDDVPELLNNYDLFVLCSKAEGTPQVIREAMFAGLPIIATNVGGMGEVISNGRNGFILEDYDFQKLSKHLLFFMNNRSKIAEFGKNSRNNAEKLFLDQEWVSSYNQLFKSIA